MGSSPLLIAAVSALGIVVASLIALRSTRETLTASQAREDALRRDGADQRAEDREDRSLERAHALDVAAQQHRFERAAEQLRLLREVHRAGLAACSAGLDAEGASTPYDAVRVGEARERVRETLAVLDLDAGEEARTAFRDAQAALETLWWNAARCAVTSADTAQAAINAKELRDARLVAVDAVEAYRAAARADVERQVDAAS